MKESVPVDNSGALSIQDLAELTVLGSRKCIGEGLNIGAHLANSRTQEASVAGTHERRGLMLPNSGRQSKSHRQLLGFCYESWDV